MTADFAAQAAQNAPMTEETLAASLTKLGGTPFVCTDIQIDLQNDVFLAKSQLNALRRAVVAALEETLLAFTKPSFLPERASLPPVEKQPLRTEKRPRRLFPNTFESLEKLLAETAASEIESICLPLTLFEPTRKAEAERAAALLKQADLFFGVRMPRVVFSCEEPAAKNALCAAARLGARYAVAENIGDLPLIRQSGLALYGGASLNVYNSQTLQFFAENGMTDITLSPELTPPQMRDLRKPPLVKTALIGAGRLELVLLPYWSKKPINTSRYIDLKNKIHFSYIIFLMIYSFNILYFFSISVQSPPMITLLSPARINTPIPNPTRQ